MSRGQVLWLSGLMLTGGIIGGAFSEQLLRSGQAVAEESPGQRREFLQAKTIYAEEFYLVGQDNQTLIHMGIDNQGGGVLVLADATGTPRVKLWTENMAAKVAVFDKTVGASQS